MSSAGIKLLKELEGVVPYEYICAAGKKTIGVGCRTDLPNSPLPTKYYTDTPTAKVAMVDEIEKHVVDGNVKVLNDGFLEILLSARVVEFENFVIDAVLVSLTQREFDAFVCFAFNNK